MKRDVLAVIDLQDEFIKYLHDRLHPDYIQHYLNRCKVIVDRALAHDVEVLELNYAGYEASTLMDGENLPANYTMLWKEDDDGSQEILDYTQDNGIDVRYMYLIGINRSFCIARTALGYYEKTGKRARVIPEGTECKAYDNHWGAVSFWGDRDFYTNKAPVDQIKPNPKLVSVLNGWKPVWARQALEQVEFGYIKTRGAKWRDESRMKTA